MPLGLMVRSAALAARLEQPKSAIADLGGMHADLG